MDSNAVIDLFNYSLPENAINLFISIQPRISIVTQIEILSKKGLNQSEIAGIKRFIEQYHHLFA